MGALAYTRYLSPYDYRTTSDEIPMDNITRIDWFSMRGRRTVFVFIYRIFFYHSLLLSLLFPLAANFLIEA